MSVALAGFTPDEVALTVEHNVLTLEGRKAEKEEKTFLHRGISTRSFKRQFTLADHVEVKGARFENGLLIIELQREVPEAMKPRRIAISGAGPGNVSQIEAKAA
ncbi:Hsp20 family protein [Bradyrhizobium lablabi]|uniref:Hsp20 family protein n=1 Tax=Bradyrhizobium lablabi TaxID=722472 RepID=UPI003D31743A